jgi:hypothetical protein
MAKRCNSPPDSFSILFSSSPPSLNISIKACEVFVSSRFFIASITYGMTRKGT